MKMHQMPRNQQKKTPVSKRKTPVSEKKSPVSKKKKSDDTMPFTLRVRNPRITQIVKNTQTVTSTHTVTRTQTVKNTQTVTNTQTELNSVKGIHKCSLSNNLNVSNDSLNVSGVQCLPSSPQPRKINKTKEKENRFIFKGVNAFVDHKIMGNDRTGRGIKYFVAHLGGQIEKTFNRKVTHVVFYDGYTKTYNTAMNRKIPLVSSMWVQASMDANTLMDPVDFPAMDLEKYTKQPQEYKNEFTEKKRKLYSLILLGKEEIYENAEFYKKYNITPLKIEEIPKTVKTPKRRKSTKKKANISGLNETKTTTDETPEINEEVIYIPSSMTKTPMPTGTINVLASHILKVLNSGRLIPEEKDSLFPVSIKLLRKLLIPNGDEVRPSNVVNSELVEIEDHLKLTYANRKLLRKLLFPILYTELQDISFDIDLTLQ